MTLHQSELGVTAPRSYSLKERAWAPSYRKYPDHCPEPGLGGSSYYVAYHGDHLGDVVSLWDLEHGVHWRATAADGRILAEVVGGLKVPRAFATMGDAFNALLVHAGITGDYDCPANPDH